MHTGLTCQLCDLHITILWKESYTKKTKINSGFNFWEKIMFGVPQGPALGSLLFNMFRSVPC